VGGRTGPVGRRRLSMPYPGYATTKYCTINNIGGAKQPSDTVVRSEINVKGPSSSSSGLCPAPMFIVKFEYSMD